ncbi:hypothetical protein RW64_16885 [Geobacter sulfurreducens]|nr:hypothetical protein RW64_16885 [Geobacter sulfurreducens]
MKKSKQSAEEKRLRALAMLRQAKQQAMRERQEYLASLGAILDRAISVDFSGVELPQLIAECERIVGRPIVQILAPKKEEIEGLDDLDVMWDGGDDMGAEIGGSRGA